MFREMRRSGQALSEAESIEILRAGTSGVLALSGDDGYPYAVPLSYVYRDGKLYFHCATSGHKLDAIRQNEKASFCAIDRDDVLPARYTTCYRSAIAFGKIRILESDAEKRAALDLLAEKYAPGDASGRAKEIERGYGALHILEFTIEHLTGKEAKELALARQNR